MFIFDEEIVYQVPMKMYDLFLSLSPFLPFDFVHQALGEKTLDYVAPAGLAQLTAGVAMQ